MPSHVPHLAQMTFYLISVHIFYGNPRSSNHWRLNPETGQILQVWDENYNATFGKLFDFFGSENRTYENESQEENERIFSILTNSKTVRLGNGHWAVVHTDDVIESLSDHSLKILSNGKDHSMSVTGCRSQKNNQFFGPKNTNSFEVVTSPSSTISASHSTLSAETIASQAEKAVPSTTKQPDRCTVESRDEFIFNSEKKSDKSVLDCGKPANYTIYDNLSGIINRFSHINIEEPEVAVIFRKKGSKSTAIDMNQIEQELRMKPKSVHLYNQIGNFWRVKGNTLLAVECFRKALSISPNSADVLLNLARVLFNLKYLENAIHLTKKSLDSLAPKTTWLQHYTLGEILHAYGQLSEALAHYRRTLELNPRFQPAKTHITSIESQITNPSFNLYTVVIISLLVACVVLGILSTFELGLELFSSSEDEKGQLSVSNGPTPSGQRHFNRAMAIRSIKFGLNPKWSLNGHGKRYRKG